jgi:hypothetical protein
MRGILQETQCVQSRNNATGNQEIKMEEPLSRRERRELRKRERETQTQEREERLSKRDRNKRIRNYGIIIVVLALIGYGIFYQLNRDFGPRFLSGQVHWHAKIRLETCGEYRSLEGLGSETNHFGNQILHTHGDNLYHLEGAPRYRSEITLGRFFNAIGVPVENDRLYQYSNGQVCPNGTSGMVRMTVNGQPVANITGYAPQDNDTVLISFG